MMSTKASRTAAALTGTLGLAAASWFVALRQMSGMDMGAATDLGSFAFFIAVWVVLPTHWVAVLGMGVPLQAPAAVDVAVVFPQPEVQRAGESRDERDVGERPAHEVVAVRWPVDQVVQAGRDGHARQATSTAAPRSWATFRRAMSFEPPTGPI